MAGKWQLPCCKTLFTLRLLLDNTRRVGNIKILSEQLHSKRKNLKKGKKQRGESIYFLYCSHWILTCFIKFRFLQTLVDLKILVWSVVWSTFYSTIFRFLAHCELLTRKKILLITFLFYCFKRLGKQASKFVFFAFVALPTSTSSNFNWLVFALLLLLAGQ